MTGRFAPSPTGRMHLGNIATALISWLSARSQGGRWLVRIEDLDRGRSRDSYAQIILDDLDWLGLLWDEEPLYQSQRDEIYHHYFEVLDTYPCYCTRADLMAASAPHASDGHHVYSGTCRPKLVDEPGDKEVNTDSPTSIVGPISDHIVAGASEARNEETKNRRPAWRVMVPDVTIEFDDKGYGHQRVELAKEWGDFVVRRANGEYAYQMAVTVDDALSGVTEVVRGVDLLSSTAPQLFLYDTLGLKAPTFAHIPLICNAQGQRLSKRDQSLSMEQLRANLSPQQIIGKMAYLYGLQPTPDAISACALSTLFTAPSFRQMSQRQIILD